MRDHRNWTIGLGAWGGIQVSVHLFFLLFAAAALYLSWLSSQQTHDATLPWFGWSCLGVLFASVLLHEAAHVFMARRLGVFSEEIVLWPCGGLAPPPSADEPRADLLINLAGPVANLVVCIAICFPLLVFETKHVDLLGLLNPLEPARLTEGSRWLVAIKLIFWINSLLFGMNLLPAFPFDGGRILASGLMIAWPATDRRRASLAVALVAKCMAIALVGASILIYQSGGSGLVPAWFAMALLAIFIYFSAKQEEALADEEPDEEEAPFGYDFSQGYTSLERTLDSSHETPSPSTLSRWLEQRREMRERRQKELEQEEERRVDEILARLHEVGLEQLTTEDRQLLQRVSARYRSRMEKLS